MPSPNERRRNNVRAGVFVTVSLVLALVIIMLVSGAWDVVTRRTHEFTVRFPTNAGISNLTTGSQVRVGGLIMGRVSGIRPRLVEGEAFEVIEVDFDVDADVQLFADARVLVATPLLGTDAWIDIPSVGSSRAGPPPAGVIEGTVTSGMLGAMLGADNASKATEIIGNAEAFSTFLAEVPAEYKQRVVPILDDVGEAADDARALVAEIRHENWPAWSGRVDQVMTWAGEFTTGLDEAVEQGRGLFVDARAAVNDNREGLDRFMVNMETASEDVGVVTDRLRNETVEKLHAVLDGGKGAVDDASATLERMRADYTGWAVTLQETLANTLLTSQQLKLTMIEVRRSPWKVLYRPDVTEVEHELLYDATRSFALATADLKAASRSVQEILDRHPEQLESDPELRERMQRNLIEPLERYEAAQQRLLDILFETKP